MRAVSPAAVNANGPVAELAELGVARVSLGAGLWRAARGWLAEHLKTLR